MDEGLLQVFQSWFGCYVKGFYSADPAIQVGIELKESHTYRVCDNIVRIGRSLSLGAEDLRLAETIALFHDVGRFFQFFHYHTFNDRRSENHALLGLREIERAGVLSCVAEEQQNVIFKSIKYHNLAALPETLGDRCLLFARLIRDADKLDIIGLFVANYAGDREFGPVMDSGLPDTPGYSPMLVENLFHHRGCSYADLKNRNDRKLLHLSWIFDINYPYTLSEFVRKGYVQGIVDSLPNTEEIRGVCDHLQAYVTSRLGLSDQK